MMNAQQKEQLKSQLQSLREDCFKVQNGITLAYQQLDEIKFEDLAKDIESLKHFQAWGCTYNLDGMSGASQVIIDFLETLQKQEAHERTTVP